MARPDDPNPPSGDTPDDDSPEQDPLDGDASDGDSRPGVRGRSAGQGDGPPVETLVLGSTRLLAGKYKLSRQLGGGGMGTVYEAEHVGLSAKVAVKLLGDRVSGDETFAARFHREARIAAAVRHDNVVTVTDYGVDESAGPFLVMEMLEGESLASVLGRLGRLEPEIAVSIVFQVLDGLHAAHQREIVHRDLKPANVFLAVQSEGMWRAKILDFGLSKFVQPTSLDVTQDGAVLGTPGYMAPEQMQNTKEVDPRSDVYAVGVILFRMLTGELPRPSRALPGRSMDGRKVAGQEQSGLEPTQGSRSQARRDDTPVPARPRDLNPAVTPALETVVLRAIEIEPERRFANAQGMRQALEEIFSRAPQPKLSALPLVTGAPPQKPSSAHPPGLFDSETRDAHASDRPPGARGATNQSEISTQTEAPGPTRESRRPSESPRGPRSWMRRAALSLGFVAVVGVSFLGWQALVAPRTRSSTRVDTGRNVGAGSQTLRYGIARYLPRAMVEQRHQPLADYLAHELGTPVELVVVEDYIDLSARLRDARIEFAALSAYSYVRASEEQNNIKLLAAAVNQAGKSYEGYILTKADSQIRTLRDLEGKNFCYVTPSSTSGYLYPRALMRQAGIDPDLFFKTTRFGGDHLGTLRALYSGACEGAAVYASILFEAGKHEMPPQSFRILASTDRIPYDAYCGSPELPEKLARRLQKALLALSPDSARTAKILRDSGDLRGFASAQDQDYEAVRRMLQYMENTDPE